MEGSRSTMIRLNNSNWVTWKPRMEDILYCKDLHEPIEGDKAKPEGMSDVDWKKMNRKAIGTIREWVDDSVFHHVSNEVDAYQLWLKLESLFEKKTAAKKAFLIKELVNVKFKEGARVTEYLNNFQSTINQLATMGMNIDDELQALLLLGSLPDSWETFVVTVSNSAPNGVLSLDNVKDNMLNEETRRKSTSSSSDNTQVFLAENRGRSKSRGPKGQGRSVSKSRTRFNGKCHHCGLFGHMKRNCNKLKKGSSEGRDGNDHQSKENTSSTSVVCQGDVFDFLCLESECLHFDDCAGTGWVVDSGASFHATANSEYFTTYKAGDFGTVRMGNESYSRIAGIGDICFETDMGYKLMLKDVRHVPGMRLNLLSTGVLDRQGFHHHGGDGKWRLTKGSLVVARGKLCCTLYKTYGKICKRELNVADGSSPNLWHKRLGHMSEKGLQVLANKSLIPFAKGTSLDSCDYCLYGKQHKVSFKSKISKKENVLDLVHSDVCGPMEEPSLGGNNYFVTFIDDASRKVWVYLLKTKDQVFQTFTEFHAMVERETGKTLKCLRSDNGGEYTSNAFKEYCSKHGIRHVRTIPGTPQHNGIAERLNRTILEKVRSMLKTANLSKKFWGEAVTAACYLINRTPCVPLDLKTPESVWTGKDASYSHLRVFGCKAFAHVPKKQRSKLDDKAIPTIFLGYGNEEMGYRLWDPKSNKLIRSRDVVFQEDQTVADLGKDVLDQVERFTYDPSLLHREPRGVAQDITNENVPNEEAEPEDGDQENHDQGELHEEDPNQAEQVEEGPNQGEQVEPVRRSIRVSKPNSKYPASQYILVTSDGEPECFKEAMSHADNDKWMLAMKSEMESLLKNNTYDLVELPKGRKALKNKWVFKLKRDENEQLTKFKARLVVKGFGQKEGVDFDEIFSPVVKMTSIRVILGMAASMDLEVEQLDVKTAFLHGDLEEEIYMEQPEGFEVEGKDHMVCKLKKSLYGLKQAPRQWYKKFDSFMVSHGYKRTDADPCVYIQQFLGGKFIILLLYVDDMLIVGQDMSMICKLKADLSKAFDMKDLGPAKQILGMEITRERKKNKLWLSQERYIERVLERFNMKGAKDVSSPLGNHFKLSRLTCPTSQEEKNKMSGIPYASAVGSLMYAMVCTRPDIAHAVGIVSRYLSNPGKEHWEAVKWILRYLRGTSKFCLSFGGSKPVLEGFTDADLAGDLDNRKSTSGYIFTFAGGAVSWQSKLQKCVALSTTESEYIAANEAGKEMIWLQRFVQELGMKQDRYVLHCDSQSAIQLSKNSVHHPRTKHIELRYHWIRDVISRKLFQLGKIHTDKNTSDMLTKVVPQEKLQYCSKAAGMDFK